MFEVYVDRPPATPAPPTPASNLVKTKLTISKQQLGDEEVTLAPRLSFASFAGLKAQIEDLVRSLAGFEEGRWCLLSVQFCDDDFDLVELLPSTFDPRDFENVQDKVYLRVTVGNKSTGATAVARQHLSAPLPPSAVHGKKAGPVAGRVTGPPPRRALARRDENVLRAAGGGGGAAAASALGGREGSARKKPALPAAVAVATPRAAAAAGGVAVRAARPPPPTTSQKAKRTTPATPRQQHQQQCSLHPASAKVATRGVGRDPAYVFKAGRLGNSSTTGDDPRNREGRDGARGSPSKPPLPSGRGRSRPTAVAAAAGGAKRPGWNSGNEPAWEEAERKKAAMRKAARARILGKRAAAAAQQVRGGGKGDGGGGGGGRRVFRRARRDCLVMDARRKRLGAYLFCDPIGAPPPSLGKRRLEAYRELGRAAAAKMKYVPIADGDPSPKRGRGEGGGGGGGGVGFVVFPRGDAAVMPASLPAATASSSDGTPGATQKTVTDKRIVIVASNTNTSFSTTPARKSAAATGAAARSPYAAAPVPSALRPPTSRPGDIGFFRGGQGAAALTAAAAAKVRVRAASSSGSSRASVRGSARQRRGGAVAAYKEAAGLRGKKEDASAAAAIMAKLKGGGGGRGKGQGGGGGGGGSAAGGGGGDVESLQEQVALLKAAAGLSDEELTWRMETAKPEANAYRIAAAALERAETTYERLLWRQGQLETARARLAGRGVGGDAATAAFATAASKVEAASPGALGQEDGGSRVLSRLKSSSEGVLEVRAAARAMAKLATAVLATLRTGSEVDYASVKAEVGAEAQRLRDLADGHGRELAALSRRVEAAVGQMEAWQQRKAGAPEFAAEEAAREEAWSEANREAGASVDGGRGATRVGGVFYPSDLCVRLKECRPLHWLVSAPEDIAGANFLAGEGAAAFTQLEGMDLTEMRAVWSVLPREFLRDGDGKKAEWRARFRVQLEGLARQQDGAIVTAGWDPVRRRRATARMPPLPAHRARNPAYFYPSVEAMASRVARLREQRRRLDARKRRLSELEAELGEAKAEVDSACADARSGELRERYGADTLRGAREAAKEAHSVLVREKRRLLASVAEAEKMLSSAYPPLTQLEAEAESIAGILDRAATADADNNEKTPSKGGEIAATIPDSTSASAPIDRPGVAATATVGAVRVPGAFSAEPELRRRAVAAARKLTPEEERRLRTGEVQRAVSARDVAGGVGGGQATTSGAAAAVAEPSPATGGGGVAGTGAGESAEARPKGKGSAAPGPFAVAAAAAAGPECPSAETSSAGAGAAAVAVPVAPSAKPMSKTLAALLARRADRPPPSGPAGGGGCDGDENEARKKATSPPLGFLGELKARAAAAAAKGAGAGPEREGKAALPTGGSFLDELKARTARIS
ncbi:conserved unknown protein [Ectocarpus siliculosus]|uniref:Uncharacterized protein n=1 Tax=Ectocarpus siliculosus TaxID=2880 RepID=D7FRP3_ECTSI|nr:conserved unknown protein [Ectocarpus siliculosus]|eukprot:CBJ30834.1 conserved unknown protein [Ectocarpus siliculosus]